MRQIVCDKCGQTRESRECTVWIGRSSKGVNLRDIDLCYSCAFDLYKWLKGEPIPKQTQTTEPWEIWRPKSSNKTLILEMLHKAGSDGMCIGEILRCNPKFRRKTISPQLSRWAKEGLVVNRNGRHYLADHT